jgi:hypothetical protein
MKEENEKALEALEDLFKEPNTRLYLNGKLVREYYSRKAPITTEDYWVKFNSTWVNIGRDYEES